MRSLWWRAFSRYAIGGSNGVRDARPFLSVQLLSFSCSFHQKSCQIIGFRQLLRGGCPHLVWEILDAPLYAVADPKFSRWSRVPTQRGGHQPIVLAYFSRKLKMKREKGGYASPALPLNPLMLYFVQIILAERGSYPRTFGLWAHSSGSRILQTGGGAIRP